MIFKFLIENSENTMGRKESIEDTGPKKVSTRGLGNIASNGKKNQLKYIEKFEFFSTFQNQSS